MEKPDYYHTCTQLSKKTLLIQLDLVEQNVMNNYKNAGNPAASRKQLLNVWIRVFKAFIWYLSII